MKVPPPRKSAGQATGRRRINGELLLDVAGTTTLLGGTEKQTRARVARGDLPYRKWSGRIVFIKADVLEYMRRLPGLSVDEALANSAARTGEEAGW